MDPRTLAQQRASCLDALVVRGVAEPTPACAAWLAEVLPKDGRAPIGLAPAGTTADQLEALAWAGMPLAVAGPLRWGVDVREDTVATPQRQGQILVVPPPNILRSLTSLALKPMRRFVADRLGCRLLGAPGIRMWLWPKHAVIMSQSDIPLAGFVYGDAPGHRATMALQPYTDQVISW